MQVLKKSPEIDNAIVSPSNWGDEKWVHEQLAWLRSNEPLKYLSPDGFEPFWNVTKYEDIKTFEGDKRLFVNDPRPTLSMSFVAEAIEQLTGRKHLVRSLVQMDDPDHMQYRRLTQSWFVRGNLRKLQSRIDQLASEYVDRMLEMGGSCDFVKDVAIWFPLRVIMSILGVPQEDEPLMLKLTQELFGSTDPDVARSFEMMDIMNVVRDFEDYFAGLTQARRDNPTDDVASVIANAEVDGQRLPEHETNGYYMIIATAGHDTTSSSTAGGLLALIENPMQMERFRADPDGLMSSAIDEMIRWVSPVRHFMRTATEDTIVSDTEIRQGESAILWYPSANRDESIFDKPFEFRVDRSDAKQLAFGFGAHVCLGQHLARMEMASLYKALFERVSDIELDGEPKYTQSTFVGGLKSLPIRYRIN